MQGHHPAIDTKLPQEMRIYESGCVELVVEMTCT
jgi:hypothetical protein